MLTTDASEVHYPVTADREDLVREFMESPRGPHSLELQRVLHRMRWSGTGTREVLLTVETGREWVLCQLPPERGMPLRIIDERTFTSLEDAEKWVFCLRWRRITGKWPDVCGDDQSDDIPELSHHDFAMGDAQ